MNDTVPPLAGLTPVFTLTVLECRRPDDETAFRALRQFLRDTLGDPGRSHAVRLPGERLLTDPTDEVDGLGPLADVGPDALYVLVRERWQHARWSADLHDLIHELTIAVRRRRLVAVHSPVSGQLLRRWTRSGAPYQFLPESVLAETFPENRDGISATPPWSRLVSPARLEFEAYLADAVDALDRLGKALDARGG